jgi:hypothetical protein
MMFRKKAQSRFEYFFYVLQKNIQSAIPTQSERYFDRRYKTLRFKKTVQPVMVKPMSIQLDDIL